MFTHKDASMAQQHVPGMTSLRDLHAVGRGHLAAVLERAGAKTVADVRAIASLQQELDFLRAVQRAIDELRAEPEHAYVVDWTRIGRKAYRVLVVLKSAEVSLQFDDIPDFFRCPLSGDWMIDPVTTPAGHSYERAHVELWVQAAGTDPMTRAPLEVSQLRPNIALRQAIETYRPQLERVAVPTRTSI